MVDIDEEVEVGPTQKNHQTSVSQQQVKFSDVYSSEK